MRLILNRNRYERIAVMHRDAKLEPVIEYIRNLGLKFYKYQLQNENALLKDITRIRYHNSISRIKHKLPYQNLPIFNEESMIKIKVQNRSIRYLKILKAGFA